MSTIQELVEKQRDVTEGFGSLIEEKSQQLEALQEELDRLRDGQSASEAELARLEELAAGGPVTVASVASSKPKSTGKSSTKKKPASTSTDSGSVQRAKNDISLRELTLQVLKRNRRGLKLAEVVTKCREAGYKSNTKGDFSQIVYQTLYKLMKEDEPKVTKDDDKYVLNAA